MPGVAGTPKCIKCGKTIGFPGVCFISGLLRTLAAAAAALRSHANAGSWKLMEKLGMVRREDLDFSDPAYPAEDNPTIQYSLSREQWEST